MAKAGPLTEMDPEQFATLYRSLGPAELARLYNTPERRVNFIRVRAEKAIKESIVAPGVRSKQRRDDIANLQDVGFEAKEAIDVEVKGRTVLVASDCHYWPGMVSTAHLGLLKFCREMNPAAVIMNGDVLDGATISRFPPPGWEYQPQLIDELDACFDRLKEVEAASPKARKIWTYGNHDQRFELKLATLTTEYKGIKGFHLHDHFERWERCWAVFVNHRAGSSQGVCIKHRFKGGVHAPYNNIIHAGMHMVTGHLHSAKVTPKTNYHGTFWGVDSGTLAEPKGRQFTNYTEAGPTDWRSGFVVLTFDDQGNLMQPELCLTVSKGVMQFRGEYVDVVCAEPDKKSTKPVRTAGKRKQAKGGKA